MKRKTVPPSKRNNALPQHFPGIYLQFEQSVFHWMGRLIPAYNGGMWEFYELENGGFYMAPDIAEPQTTAISVDSNYYEGMVSWDAAGIVACLFAMSHLTFHPKTTREQGELLSRKFHQLREYALTHAEAGEIFQAID